MDMNCCGKLIDCKMILWENTINDAMQPSQF